MKPARPRTVAVPRAELLRLLKASRQTTTAIEALLRERPANDNAVAQIRANRAELAAWYARRVGAGETGNETQDWHAAIAELPFYLTRDDVREVRRPAGKRRSGPPSSRG